MKLANTIMINETLLPSNKKAFTLAEVLITLSILGVVAALTIPSLVNRQSDLAAQTKLKKAIAAYEQVAAVYMVENNATNISGMVSSCDNLKNYFKIVTGPTVANEGCDFTTADGAAWHISTKGAVAGKDAVGVEGDENYQAAVPAQESTAGYATIADSTKSPRYAVFVWTKNGQVNGVGSTDGVGNGPTKLVTQLNATAGALKPNTRKIAPATEFLNGTYTCTEDMVTGDNKPACGTKTTGTGT